MKYQIAIFSADVIFARMLELEFTMRDKLVFRAERPQETVYAEIVLLDLDTVPLPMPETYGRLIGFTRNSSLLTDDTRRKCSMILHRPFEMRLLRQEILTDEQMLAELTLTDWAKNKPDLRLDEKERTLFVADRGLKLSPNETVLMKSLLENRGKILSRGSLSEVIGESQANKVDVYICYLRRKLEDACGLRIIDTVRQQGYLIK